VLSPLASVLKLASLAICLIVIASFVLFVVNRTSSASQHQQRQVSGETATANGETQTGIAPDTGGGKGSARRTIDEASEAVTSPFSSLTDGSSSEWVIHAVDLGLALLVYGFGLGYIARAIRVRI
jgi:cobalamin biosynthesis Mg chelatase CobN